MNVCILKMLYFDRIDISKGIDVNKVQQKGVIFVNTSIS